VYYYKAVKRGILNYNHNQVGVVLRSPQCATHIQLSGVDPFSLIIGFANPNGIESSSPGLRGTSYPG
jgi:hypothetical protein